MKHLALLAALLCACAHPWNIVAHATINGTARGLVVLDAVEGDLIASDPEQDPDALARRYLGSVIAIKATAFALREAERIVEAAERVESADKCQALLAVREAVTSLSRSVASLQASGLTAVPQEVLAVAQIAQGLAPLITSMCPHDQAPPAPKPTRRHRRH